MSPKKEVKFYKTIIWKDFLSCVQRWMRMKKEKQSEEKKYRQKEVKFYKTIIWKDFLSCVQRWMRMKKEKQSEEKRKAYR